MDTPFKKRVLVTILATAVSIAVLNGATLYVQYYRKDETQRRISALEADVAAQKRKNVAVDRFIGAVMKELRIESGK